MIRYVSQDLGVELELVSSLFVQVWSLSVLLSLQSRLTYAAQYFEGV